MKFFLVATDTILDPESRLPIVNLGDVLDAKRIQSLADKYGVDHIEGVFCFNEVDAHYMRELTISAGH